MIRLDKLQFLGPSLLLVVVGMAEGCVWGLAHAPTSEALWYLNLEIFGVFQRSYNLLPFHFSYSQLLLIAMPLFAIAAFGFFARRAFALALASNMSFVYAAFLLIVSIQTQPHTVTASLAGIAIPAEPNIYAAIVTLAASLVSFLVSHFEYARRIFRIMRNGFFLSV